MYFLVLIFQGPILSNCDIGLIYLFLNEAYLDARRTIPWNCLLSPDVQECLQLLNDFVGSGQKRIRFTTTCGKFAYPLLPAGIPDFVPPSDDRLMSNEQKMPTCAHMISFRTVDQGSETK
jgi:hypothetical protein